MRLIHTKLVSTVLQNSEHLFDLGMNDGLPAVVDQQILLRNIGDIRPLFILREQVIERLVFMRANLFGYRQPPLFGVGILGIDIEYDSAEGIDAVADDLTEMEFCGAGSHVLNEQSIDIG